jgi:RecA-family ATPase
MTNSIKTQTTQLDLRYCAENEPPQLDFVIPGFLAGTVGCISAAGSTGKSFWSLETAMGVCSSAADKALLNLGINSHGPVVMLNAEDPAPILHRRFHDACSYLSIEAREEVFEKLRIEVLTGTMPNIMEQKWQESVLKATEGARLVIFDTLTRWHQMDENSNGDMSQVLSVFEMICRETGAAVLFLHHVSKGMAKERRQDEQQATRGAAAITDNARWQGWMQSMSTIDAELYGIAEDERWRYVSTGGNKENYGQSTPTRWLERKNGGILMPVELKNKETTKNGARNHD